MGGARSLRPQIVRYSNADGRRWRARENEFEWLCNAGRDGFSIHFSGLEFPLQNGRANGPEDSFVKIIWTYSDLRHIAIFIDKNDGRGLDLSAFQEPFFLDLDFALLNQFRERVMAELAPVWIRDLGLLRRGFCFGNCRRYQQRSENEEWFLHVGMLPQALCCMDVGQWWGNLPMHYMLYKAEVCTQLNLWKLVLRELNH